MSSPCSKYRVAVTVDHAITENATTAPRRFFKSAKSVRSAKKTNGSSE